MKSNPNNKTRKYNLSWIAAATCRFAMTLLSVVTLCLSLTACDGKKEETASSAKPVIKIGATLPLSGDSSVAGVVAKKSLEMVLEDLKENNLKYDYQLVFENNEDSTKKTALTTNKLINIDKVNAVFSLWNYMGSVVASISNPKKIINMTCSWEEPSLIGPYTFNTISTNEQIASLLVDTLKTKGIKSVAILIDNSGEIIIKTVIEKLKQAQIEIVFNEVSNMGHTDYKMEIMKAAAKTPDIYVIIGAPPMPFLFTKQLGEITGKRNVTGIDGFMEMTEEQRSIVNNLWYVDNNVNGTKEFATKLLQRTGVETQSCAGNLAASLQVLINAYENTNAADSIPTSDELVRYIQNNTKNVDTASGKASLIRDNIINIKPLLRRVEGGKIINFEE